MGYAVIQNGFYTIECVSATINPLDSTSYYFGNSLLIAAANAGAVRQQEIPYRSILIGASMACVESVSFGTGETSTIYFRLNDTTDTTLSAAVNNAAQFIDTITGLSTVVEAGDKFEIKWTTPAWGTNPMGSAWKITLIFKLV